MDLTLVRTKVLAAAVLVELQLAVTQVHLLTVV
jgi:hypothetical protein